MSDDLPPPPGGDLQAPDPQHHLYLLHDAAFGSGESIVDEPPVYQGEGLLDSDDEDEEMQVQLEELPPPAPGEVRKRFAGGVPAFDVTLRSHHESDPNGLAMRLPPYARTAEGKSWGAKRATLPLIFCHDLYPIVPPLRLGEMQNLGTESWTSAWWEAGYTHYPTTAETYFSSVSQCRSLWGETRNPIDNVVAFAQSMGDYDVLVHYIFAVALQFYVTARGQWMRVRTDRAFANFNEALPPYLAQVPRIYAVTAADLDAAPELDDLTFHARAQTLPVFFWQVAMDVQEQYELLEDNEAYLKRCRTFAIEKLTKNTLQSVGPLCEALLKAEAGV